jgi:hypothetical protein
MCVAQLPDILEKEAEFEPSPFFSDQLTAFEVWLSMQPPDGPEEPPEQLPIVLQVDPLCTSRLSFDLFLVHSVHHIAVAHCC